ncbi:hypothetical protein TNCT_594391 [Trichonephila clavata]|uniref:Uncharacterized protein n=1 Tax=Trichonephila clavata TaxID=2740835 RepID=A0A8X6HPI4_TRICU|nr:hypothetical protein TNCT_594391 [Trichonephila clavata]
MSSISLTENRKRIAPDKHLMKSKKFKSLEILPPSVRETNGRSHKKKAKKEESVSSGRFGKLRMGAKTGDQVQEKRSVSQRTPSQSFLDVTQEPFLD